MEREKNLDNMLFLLASEEKIATNYLEELEQLCAYTLDETLIFDTIVKSEDSHYPYCFLCNGKQYSFSLFTHFLLQTYDLKTLHDKEKRVEKCILRTLKLAYSMDLKEPKVIVGKSNYNEFVTIFSFKEYKEEIVVDYSKNLVMNKKDYFELFQMHVFNELDKYDLYRIWKIKKDMKCQDILYTFLLFSKEMFKDLGRIDSWLTWKYNQNGMCMKNYILFGENFFSTNVDYLEESYSTTKDNIDAFTLEPTQNHPNISYNEKKACYIYKDTEFGNFEFCLLSDFWWEERETLLSHNRYRKCHRNATRLIYFLNEKYKQSAYIVSGSIKINAFNFHYHSWIEIEIKGKSIVIDYNQNLIIDKEKYYALYGIKVISKTSFLELEENEKMILQGDFTYYYAFFNYFGNEVTKDLKRNLHFFKKSEE